MSGDVLALEDAESVTAAWRWFKRNDPETYAYLARTVRSEEERLIVMTVEAESSAIVA